MRRPHPTPIRELTSVRYRVAMSIEVDASSDAEAYGYAEKLAELLKSPMVRMAVQGDGIKLA